MHYNSSIIGKVADEILNPYLRKMFDRITINPNQMSGEPCIRSLRIPVATIITLVAQGLSPNDILSFYPDLVKEDIVQALNFAAEAVREKEIPLKKAG